MKLLIMAAVATVALMTAAHAQQVTRYEFDHEHHTATITTFNAAPTEEVIYYHGLSEAQKAASRVEFCKRFQCAKEYPLDAKITGR